jgi:hypothetical protein
VKTSYIWRRCLLRELNVPEKWFNTDAMTAIPRRQDIFWVEVSKFEFQEHLMPFIRDAGHKTVIHEWMKNGNIGPNFHVIVSRENNYIQFYPFLNISNGDSLWERMGEATFSTIQQLKAMWQKQPVGV